MMKPRSLSACKPEKLDLLLAGTLSNEEQREVEVHLSQCQHCADQIQHFAAEDASWQTTQALLTPDVYDGPLSLSLMSPAVPEESCHFESGGLSQSETTDVLTREIRGWLDPTDDPQSLGRFAGYEITGIIGHGGMGIVLKGFESSLNRYVAVKVLAPRLATNGTARKRFAREAQAAAAVLHDNVVAIHRVDEFHGLPFLVMPYVAGISLQTRLDEEGSLSLRALLRIGSQIAAGLSAAHAQGLVHRDIKPANILLERGVERVTITDFGLARTVDDATVTRTGVIAGTPQYMSPEQTRGLSVDQGSDLFSLGSLMYAMATGQTPFRSETSFGVMQRIRTDVPRSIRELNPEIPEWLAVIVKQLMNKSPEERLGPAQEVTELLEDCLAHVQQPTIVPLPSGIPQSTSPSTQRRTHPFFFQGLKMMMIAALCIGLMAMVGTQVTAPADIAGKWTSEEWGQVVLREQTPGVYQGVYSGPMGHGVEPAKMTDLDVKWLGMQDVFHKDLRIQDCSRCHAGNVVHQDALMLKNFLNPDFKHPPTENQPLGTVTLKWSRIERRYNGEWREGQDRFGSLSVRLVNDEVRGAWTTSDKSRINPATPKLADLSWSRPGKRSVKRAVTNRRTVPNENQKRVMDLVAKLQAARKQQSRYFSTLNSTSQNHDNGMLDHYIAAVENEKAQEAIAQSESELTNMVAQMALESPWASSFLPYEVPFEQGVTRFDDGDTITIQKIRGTAKTFLPGHFYQITGTYTLVSHPEATLAAYVTAKDAKDRVSTTLSAQTTSVQRSSDPKQASKFTLYVPMTCEGWPHVSFYSVGTGEGIGGSYFGTQASVLKQWWGETDHVSGQDSSIPVLGEIPDIGRLFQSQSLKDGTSKEASKPHLSLPRTDKTKLRLIPVFGPTTSGGKAASLDPPSDAVIWRAIEQRENTQVLTPGLKGLSENQRDQIKIIKEKIADYVDPARSYPLIGRAQLHHANYKCKFIRTGEDRAEWPQPHAIQRSTTIGTVYLDHHHYHLLVNEEANLGRSQ